MPEVQQVSIVIPALNEAACLGQTLRQLSILDPPAWEVLVVDGGSEDETVAIAESLGVKVLYSCKQGRSVQMNQGAQAASGDILCFLHADTVVPSDLIAVIRQALANPTVSCGGFITLIAGSTHTHWGVSLHNYLKTFYAPLLFRPHLFFKGLRLLFGDQVMFCRREDFQACGGFDPTLPIMEEADLCIKLVQRGRIRLINRTVLTSDRRIARWGPWKATALHLMIGFLWGFGVDAAYLKRFYQDFR
ncbi:TIGR04283 family arsenosugar biosynthesis glycosyltransferase [Leptolyngbya sp. FACHB-261]|uniref:TIGR04283 family arsenosugar biosynthesis glycosyltransferase n=1 Tax=Leptolyngbya sp. FACHB-261 TaxID=2692806 RepID=UPI0016852146|nr:TIGR04283 family arsenosugar biosynthesis glycosyltransferase [Leptolyngbya sp. FACHB-261]MBD2104544.1 TIGR04283 family arsenosugar biosynthesis glycosyltransferase [Leptolyngbya sp. FACHB-261]